VEPNVGETDALNRQHDAAGDAAAGPSNRPGPPDTSSIDPIMLEPTQAELERLGRAREEASPGVAAGTHRGGAVGVGSARANATPVEPERRGSQAVIAEWTRQAVRYPREMQLAAEGMFSLFYQWSRRQMAEFVRAGRDWEEHVARTGRRGRVHLDDDED
jgi:hypothetical protein